MHSGRNKAGDRFSNHSPVSEARAVFVDSVKGG